MCLSNLYRLWSVYLQFWSAIRCSLHSAIDTTEFGTIGATNCTTQLSAVERAIVTAVMAALYATVKRAIIATQLSAVE